MSCELSGVVSSLGFNGLEGQMDSTADEGPRSSVDEFGGFLSHPDAFNARISISGIIIISISIIIRILQKLWTV